MLQKLVMANWKMHGSSASNLQLLDALEDSLKGNAKNVAVVVCPPSAYLSQVVDRCKDLAISVGGQDCSAHTEGAFTGEIAAPMLADTGCEWVLVGHSERRQYHAESNDLLAEKLQQAVAAGLKPVLCVGETREEREAEQAQSVVANQLKEALAQQQDVSGLVVAYEPVWAIGTGLTASPEEAQAMHQFIRQQLSEIAVVASQPIPLLYGGSVKPDNAADLFRQADIDGALVGGASLKADQFAAIVSAAQVQE